METVDLFLSNADQVVTCASPTAKRGPAMQSVGFIPHGAVAVQDAVLVGRRGLDGLHGPGGRRGPDGRCGTKGRVWP